MMIDVVSNRYLLNIDYYCREVEGWIAIKEKTNTRNHAWTDHPRMSPGAVTPVTPEVISLYCLRYYTNIPKFKWNVIRHLMAQLPT